MTAMIEPGTRWRHYKGNVYEVLAIGCMKATDEKVVVYQQVGHGHRSVWVRPLREWQELVPISDSSGSKIEVARFVSAITYVPTKWRRRHL